MSAKHYVYRNLRHGNWSVKLRGIVVDRQPHVVIEDATFVVSKSGRNYAIVSGRKNVHAYVVGRLLTGADARVDLSDPQWVEISYNPYRSGLFVIRETGLGGYYRPYGTSIESAQRVVLTSSGKIYGYGVTEADILF